MFWDEIYRDDLLGSFEIHKVINSCSAFSRGQTKVRLCSRPHRGREEREEARPNWIVAMIVSAEIVTVGKAA